MIRIFSSLLFVLIFAVSFLTSGAVFAREPLLQEGKKSVYQRVATHPNALLRASPDESGEQAAKPIPTFTAMYIYDRRGDWLEVGAASDRPDGWIKSEEVTEWPQAITMLFTDRSGRDPVLFFRDHDALEETCRVDDIGKLLQTYRKDLASGNNLSDNFPVVATEPEKAAISEQNFYLLPVLSIDNQFYEQNGPRLLEIASLNPGMGKPDNANSNMAQQDEAALKTGIAFVIDTTISMKPYIDQTLDLVRKLYDELENSKYADKIGFAVVAYRSNTEKTPGLGYTAKVISDFTTAKDRKHLEDALSQVKEATVSTHDINEDAFAGIKEAVDNLSWEKYGSKVMMMATDAGPLGAGDPTSGTGMSPETLADYLKTNHIYLTALHVKAPKNRENHAYATDAYKRLTRQSDNQASYIPLEAPTPKQGARAFDSAAGVLAKSYSKVAEATAQGKLLDPSTIAPQGKSRSAEDEARRIAASTGYAMQLQFFGNKAKAQAPEIVNAWIADADLEKLAANPTDAPVLAVEPAVLLTRGQLSNLYKQLKILLEGSENAFLNGDADLFSQISSAAAQISRDPNQFSIHPDRNLAENGLLDEVLQDLPYKSVIGAMTKKDWEDMSTGQRDAFVRRIKSLLARYEAYDKDATHWESFGSPNPNDWVYRVPLSMLP